jgi:hydroxymethylpyrimidine pyrophosphatase-like HAD family hydrolase
MNDPYLNNELCTHRLYDDYKRHNKLIVAFDYDDTVFDYHNKGYSFTLVIELLRKCSAIGWHLICFTASPESRFPAIADYLDKNQIPFDGINVSMTGTPEDTRKIFYNIFLDDRAGLSAAYHQLNNVYYLALGDIRAKEKLNHKK